MSGARAVPDGWSIDVGGQDYLTGDAEVAALAREEGCAVRALYADDERETR